jgi:hypothetical protein
MNEKRGKDRGKHDGGKDASGQFRDGAKHPDSPDAAYQPESGTPVPEERQAERRDANENRHPEDDIEGEG